MINYDNLELDDLIAACEEKDEKNKRARTRF